MVHAQAAGKCCGLWASITCCMMGSCLVACHARGGGWRGLVVEEGVRVLGCQLIFLLCPGLELL